MKHNLSLKQWMYKTQARVIIFFFVLLLNHSVLGSICLVSAETTSNDERRNPEQPKERYVREIVLKLPWGTGEREIGTGGIPLEAADDMGFSGLRYGPNAFDIGPDGTIYILDSENDWVKVFRQDGTYIRSFYIEDSGANHGDIVFYNGNVWLHDGRSHIFRQYTIDGDLIKSIIYDSGPHRYGKIQIRDDNLYQHSEIFEIQESPEKSDRNGKPIYRAEIVLLDRGKWPVYIGKVTQRYYREQIFTESPRLEVIERSGETHALHFEGLEHKGYNHYIDEDADGSTYFILEIHGNHKPLQIWKYNINLKLTAIIEFFDHRITTLSRSLIIDRDGSIYSLQTRFSGVWLVKFSKGNVKVKTDPVRNILYDLEHIGLQDLETPLFKLKQLYDLQGKEVLFPMVPILLQRSSEIIANDIYSYSEIDLLNELFELLSLTRDERFKSYVLELVRSEPEHEEVSWSTMADALFSFEPAVVGDILAILDNPRHQVKTTALSILRCMYQWDRSSGTFFTIERKECLKKKATELLNDSNHEVRNLSLANLDFVGDESTIPLLESIITDDPFKEKDWFPVRDRAESTKRYIMSRLKEK